MGLSPPLLLSTVIVSLFVMLDVLLIGEYESDLTELGSRMSYSLSSAVEEVFLVVVVLKTSSVELLLSVTVSVVDTGDLFVSELLFSTTVSVVELVLLLSMGERASLIDNGS